MKQHRDREERDELQRTVHLGEVPRHARERDGASDDGHRARPVAPRAHVTRGPAEHPRGESTESEGRSEAEHQLLLEGTDAEREAARAVSRVR